MSEKSNELILAREGRAWLMETAMGILTEAEVKHMPPARIRLWVDRRYEGGWEAFERDNKALIEPDPLGGPGYYMHCGGCDAEVFVTEAQWEDTGVHMVEHQGCAYASGVDLVHARRHAD